jgi:diguanylate cyclase (GGDEF)-like protein
VLGLAAPGEPGWRHAPVYLAALAAQFAFDCGAVLLRHGAGRGVSPARLAGPLAWVVLVDSALAPLALLAGVAAAAHSAAVLCVLPFAGLVAVLERDRRRRIDATVVLGEAVEDASRTARVDSLTGVGNRLAWDEAFEQARGGDATTVLLVDLNELKEINDTYGHDAGDRLIQALAHALRRALPDAELSRLGGDEFGALAHGVDERGGAELHERLTRELTGLRTVGGLAVSASVGVASHPPCRTLGEAVQVADERLYAAKARSRPAQRSLNGST